MPGVVVETGSVSMDRLFSFRDSLLNMKARWHES